MSCSTPCAPPDPAAAANGSSKPREEPPQSASHWSSSKQYHKVGVCELVGAHLNEGALSIGTVSKSLPTHANFPRELLGPHNHNCGAEGTRY